MKLNEMRKKRASLIAEARTLLDKADGEKRDLSTEERAKYDELQGEAGRVAERIKLEERQAEAEADLGKVAEPEKEVREAPRGQTDEEKEKRFSTLGEFLVAVRRAGSPAGGLDPRLSTRAATGMNESVPSDGGFLVQTDFSTELLRRVYTTGAIASRVRRIPLSSNSNGLKINAVKENSRANGSRWGGVQAYWKDEAALKTESRPEFRQIELNLKKLTGLCYTTDELLEDAAALESVVTDAFVDEFGFKVEDAIINGTGVGQPLGIMNSGALVTVAIEATQTIANSPGFLAINAAKMLARMPARNRANAVWLANQELEPYLYTMTLGGSGGAVPVFLPQGNVSTSGFSSLLGRPVIPTEYNAALGTPGDLLLADLSEYLMIDKGGIKKDVSMHVRFIYDESVFRFVYRVDGQPIWNSALTPYKGSATQSPYVALATRS